MLYWAGRDFFEKFALQHSCGYTYCLKDKQWAHGISKIAEIPPTLKALGLIASSLTIYTDVATQSDEIRVGAKILDTNLSLFTDSRPIPTVTVSVNIECPLFAFSGIGRGITYVRLGIRRFEQR